MTKEAFENDEKSDLVTVLTGLQRNETSRMPLPNERPPD